MTIPRIDPSRGRRLALSVSLVLTFASANAVAAGTDPLQSTACRSAIDAMQAEETAEAHRHAAGVVRDTAPAPSAALQNARRDAAKRCLASRLDVEPPPGRFAQAPIVVEPVGAGASSHGPAPTTDRLASPTAPTAPTAPMAPTPRPPGRPDTVTSCDSGGCWASDGSRLNRVGPVLWGPRGACTVAGASLQCP